VTLQATLTPQQRSRREEDVFVSHILLTCLEEALKPDEYENTGNSSASNMNELASSEHPTTVSTTTATTKFGDVLQLSRSARPTTIQQRLFDAANRILIDNEPCVMLFGKDFIPSALPVLPPNSVIVPGSFHPLHHGHVALAKAALEAAKGSVIFFELSLVNADKPSLQANQVVQRLQTFLTLQKELLELDQRWGILLTNAPLFVDKVQLLEPFQALGVDSENDRLNFVIGTDTLVRLVDPKYYGGSSEAMLETISSMPCQFVVGGRLEQKKGTDKHEPAVFVTGQQTVDALPQVLQEKFIVLPDFRVDISSTELREKMSKQ
jgi:nicotinic acid mononucleotide adenylyltransferase